MDAEQKAKIETGVLNCLDECRAVQQPYTRVTAFIEGLKTNPNWSAEEIVELQTQVIKALLFRHDRIEGPAGVVTSAAPPRSQSWLGLTSLVVILLIVMAVVVLAVFLSANVVLNNQFRGLREQRQDAIKLLRQPPRILPQVPTTPEPTPPAEPGSPPRR